MASPLPRNDQQTLEKTTREGENRQGAAAAERESGGIGALYFEMESKCQQAAEKER